MPIWGVGPLLGTFPSCTQLDLSCVVLSFSFFGKQETRWKDRGAVLNLSIGNFQPTVCGCRFLTIATIVNGQLALITQCLEMAPGTHLPVMTAVYRYERAPPCALYQLAQGCMFCSRLLLPAQALWFLSVFSAGQNALHGAPA
eukprot:572209-Pelagomonas_calceolata.AAC.1